MERCCVPLELIDTKPCVQLKVLATLFTLAFGVGQAQTVQLDAETTSMTDEDRAAHDQFSKALIKDLAPEGAMETQLAQRVATDSWRLTASAPSRTTSSPSANLENGGQTCPDDPQIDARPHLRPRLHHGVEAVTTPHPLRAAHQPSLQKNLALLQSLQAIRKPAAKPP